jgi:acyl carrier protein
VALGSEPTRASDVALFRRAFAPPCRLITRFGSSEAGNVALCVAEHEGAAVEDPLPAGWPVADREVVLLDESGAPVGHGKAGEIAIRSRYIAAGYWRRPDLTAAAFTDDPAGDGLRMFRTGDLGRWREDGCLVHLGRKDDLVKIRGHRVELGEVERVLLAAPGVADGAVVARPDRSGATRLVGYVVASGAVTIPVGVLSASLRVALPDFMVPSAFVFLDALPRTPTGKVDRRLLSAPDPVRPPLDTPFVAPSTPIERKVAAIWAEVLGIEPVGLDDGFLELGGDSLVAARVATRVGETLDVVLGPEDLLVSGTVRAMAAMILGRAAAKLGPGQLEALIRDVGSEPV